MIYFASDTGTGPEAGAPGAAGAPAAALPCLYNDNCIERGYWRGLIWLLMGIHESVYMHSKSAKMP
jgi:hypothetical protein